MINFKPTSSSIDFTKIKFNVAIQAARKFGDVTINGHKIIEVGDNHIKVRFANSSNDTEDGFDRVYNREDIETNKNKAFDFFFFSHLSYNREYSVKTNKISAN